MLFIIIRQFTLKIALYTVGETMRSIYGIMGYTFEENIPGLLIFIDIEKAFDSVEWDFFLMF